MLKHYPYQQLGKANHGWLKSSFHFSFANYYNQSRMGFGALRVINDDWIEVGSGFPDHPHHNMEIISFIKSGAVHHQDSIGNKGVTETGEIQVMSAGKGIYHSEYNFSKQPLTLYQIWIKTNVDNVEPHWESKYFSQQINNERLSLLVSGFEEDIKEVLFINQYARIYGGKVDKGAMFEHNIYNQAYVLASYGSFEVIEGMNSVSLTKGDGLEVTKAASVILKALESSEILLLDVPQ